MQKSRPGRASIVVKAAGGQWRTLGNVMLGPPRSWECAGMPQLCISWGRGQDSWERLEGAPKVEGEGRGPCPTKSLGWREMEPEGCAWGLAERADQRHSGVGGEEGIQDVARSL